MVTGAPALPERPRSPRVLAVPWALRNGAGMDYKARKNNLHIGSDILIINSTYRICWLMRHFALVQDFCLECHWGFVLPVGLGIGEWDLVTGQKVLEQKSVKG